MPTKQRQFVASRRLTRCGLQFVQQAKLLDGLETASGSAMRVTGGMLRRPDRIVKQPVFEFEKFPNR
jgi:hypothetical protein